MDETARCPIRPYVFLALYISNCPSSLVSVFFQQLLLTSVGLSDSSLYADHRSSQKNRLNAKYFIVLASLYSCSCHLIIDRAMAHEVRFAKTRSKRASKEDVVAIRICGGFLENTHKQEEDVAVF